MGAEGKREKGSKKGKGVGPNPKRGSKGYEKGEEDKSRKGKGGQGALPGSIPSEALKESVCRWCLREGHRG